MVWGKYKADSGSFHPHLNRSSPSSAAVLDIMQLLSVFASLISAVATQTLLQPLPSAYANRSDIVYIASNMAVIDIPPPFNYTGGLYIDPFTAFNLSNQTFAFQVEQAGNESFLIFDPRFIDILGPSHQLELLLNLSMTSMSAKFYSRSECRLLQ